MRSVRLGAAKTDRPEACRRRAVASPMPNDAPVTRAFCGWEMTILGKSSQSQQQLTLFAGPDTHVFETGWARSGLASATSDQEGAKPFGGPGLPRDHEILKRICPVTRWAPAMRDTANRTVGG